MTAKYVIKDTFKITGRGLVLAGYIEDGVIHLGDYIEFSAFGKNRRRKIIGIEGFSEANKNKTNTGLLIECRDDIEIDELRKWRPEGDMGVIMRD